MNFKCERRNSNVKMKHKVTFNTRIVSNDADDGTYKIKMATIGVKNENGFTIKDAEVIKYDANRLYPLLFEHLHDMNDIIGTFKPTGVDGDDVMAVATVTDPKALDMVKSGALHNASISYWVNDSSYNEDDDDTIVNDADLVELSLCLTGADPTAGIQNSRQQVENDEAEPMTDEQLKTLTDEIDADTAKITDALAELTKAITGDDSDDSGDDTDDSSDDTADDETTNSKQELAKNARQSLLSKLQRKWA